MAETEYMRGDEASRDEAGEREGREKKDYSQIHIGLASPEMIHSWSHGEVTRAETINYRSTKPEPGGLFCEVIFGPTKDWECSCGKYKRPRYRGTVCEKCGVEVTTKKVRRERMGHIDLACPVSHIWYFKATPSPLAILLDLPPKQLEQVLYYGKYILLDAGGTGLPEKAIFNDKELRENREMYGSAFRVGMGAEAIRELLSRLDLDEIARQLRAELDGKAEISTEGEDDTPDEDEDEAGASKKSAKSSQKPSAQRKSKLLRRLEVVESFRASGNRPEWMILEALPVIPPDIRPMVQLDGGRYAASDLNDLYRRVINRNNRLDKMLEDRPDLSYRKPAGVEMTLRSEQKSVDFRGEESIQSLTAPHEDGEEVGEEKKEKDRSVRQEPPDLRLKRTDLLQVLSTGLSSAGVSIVARATGDRRREITIRPEKSGSALTVAKKTASPLELSPGGSLTLTLSGDEALILRDPLVEGVPGAIGEPDLPVQVKGSAGGELTVELSPDGKKTVLRSENGLRAPRSHPDFTISSGEGGKTLTVSERESEQDLHDTGKSISLFRARYADPFTEGEQKGSSVSLGEERGGEIVSLVVLLKDRSDVEVELRARAARAVRVTLYPAAGMKSLTAVEEENRKLEILYRKGAELQTVRERELQAPDIMIRNEKRMLQEAVDSLIDNGRHGKAITGGTSNRTLKSLSEFLRGKQGRFRQNLLGKRVDYSGRSVIVVGPELKIYQCGLPKEMALELFKPFVMKRLVETGKADSVRRAKLMVEEVNDAVWDPLEEVITDHPVLLNRAPTLHRLSIQAFEPVLVEGRAIKLHPLVCTAFNADFDGDQMPVHVPLSAEAQAEARFLMLSSGNLLKPADGKAVAVPSQDMVLGCYYLTIDKAGEPGDTGDPARRRVYRDIDEAMMAYENGVLGLHTPIKVRREMDLGGKRYAAVVDATLGRLIFNREIPQDLGFVDRALPEGFEGLPPEERRAALQKALALEVTFACGKGQLKNIINRTIKRHGIERTAEVLDRIKVMGYKYSTKAAISISISDVVIPPEKGALLADAEEKVENLRESYEDGEITDDERYASVLKVWEKTTDDIVENLLKHFDPYNPIKMMSDSGARGDITQMRQLAGMRGLMYQASGRTMEVPIKANFREGLSILEYFVAARGSRKSLSDIALRTADSGYLTRRLVDVSQEVIVREEDCGATEGIEVSEIRDGGNVVETLKERLVGRYTAEEVRDPKTGDLLIGENEMFTDDTADLVVGAGIEKVKIRSILQCRARTGVCSHCYGADLSNNLPVSIGEAVGIIAAQSIGEPGTQLTMRTFHSGGVAGTNITQGLPRVEEVFEARRPKHPSVLSRVNGRVTELVLNEETGKPEAVNIEDEGGNLSSAAIPFGYTTIVTEGQQVHVGDDLTDGDKTPQELVEICGIEPAYDYIIREIQKVYRMQSVEINDKHIEVIVRQMTRKSMVDDPGDTDLLEGVEVDRGEVLDAEASLAERAKSEVFVDDPGDTGLPVREVISRERFEEENARVAGAVRVTSPGDTALAAGQIVSRERLTEENRKIEERQATGEQNLKTATFEEGALRQASCPVGGLRAPRARVVLHGITKAALYSDSFLSAASFQETTRMLTDAAIKGKTDRLQGLKENVIIGKLIPAGTGLPQYRDVEIEENDRVPDTPYKRAKAAAASSPEEEGAPKLDLRGLGGRL